MVSVTRNAEKASLPAPQPAPVANADGSYTVTDSKGRKLKLLEPDILTESRLVRSLGAASSNLAYMQGYVMPAAMVVEVDGVEMPFPMTEREVDAAIQSIGRHGLMAVMNHFIAMEKRSKGETDAVKK